MHGRMIAQRPQFYVALATMILGSHVVAEEFGFEVEFVTADIEEAVEVVEDKPRLPPHVSTTLVQSVCKCCGLH